MQYVVKSGDTLSAISQKFYGSPYYYNAIVEANPIISNADRIEIGWILTIPGSEKMGPLAPGQPTMVPPGSSVSPAPFPSPSPTPSPMPGTSGSTTKQTQTMYIMLAVAALAAGYFAMKSFSGQPAKANPSRSRKVEDDEVVDEDIEEVEDEEEEE